MFQELAWECNYQGQELLNPPSVESWHTGQEWIDGGALVRRVNFAAKFLGDASLPGIRAIVDGLKARGTLSPAEFVDGCLDLLGPLEVSQQTRGELLAQAEEAGNLRWGTEQDRPRLGPTYRGHAGAHRRFARIPVCLTPDGALGPSKQEDALWHRRSADPVVVVLQLTGANDYLNTVIPYTNPLYWDNRPNVGVPEDKVLPINDTLAFHPNMGPVKQLWDEGKVAIIHGIGYANSPRSHFRSMDIWHTCEPDRVGTEGWAGPGDPRPRSRRRERPQGRQLRPGSAQSHGGAGRAGHLGL